MTVVNKVVVFAVLASAVIGIIAIIYGYNLAMRPFQPESAPMANLYKK